MPYQLVKVPKGYFVRSVNGTYMSREPLPLERAKSQMKALYINVSDSRNKL
jgi:hypothetical protein